MTLKRDALRTALRTEDGGYGLIEYLIGVVVLLIVLFVFLRVMGLI